jgi:hypothetical protein
MMNREMLDNPAQLQQLKLAELREEFEEIAVEIQSLQTTIEIAHEAGEDVRDLLSIQVERLKRAHDLIEELCNLIKATY